MAEPKSKNAVPKKADARVRARISYKGVNYEKTVRNKEQRKIWCAQMLIDLGRCPIEIKSIRNEWVVNLDTPSGEVIKKFPTLDPAIEWLAKAKSDLSLGVYLNDKEANMTLEEYVPIWRKAKHRAKGRTMQRYMTLLNNQILPFIGDVKLKSMTPSMVRNWVGDLVENEVGAPSIKKAYALLRQIMKAAFEDEIIRRNPVVSIELPVVVPKEQRALTINELIQLTDKCVGYEAMIIVMGVMGLRIGEICALQVQDVNVFRSEMHVRRGMTHGEDFKRFSDTTKTKQVRTIPISKPVMEVLLPLLEGQKPKANVFRGVRGGAINDGWFRKAVFRPALNSLGWTDISLHNLRHTCASLLISAGTPITAVSRVLGHSSVIQTLNTYGHYYNEDIETSMKNLGSIFLAARGSDGDSKFAMLA